MSASSIPLWGRSWKLTVRSAGASGSTNEEIVSQSSWEPESLRVTFDITESTLPAAYWFAEITVWNLQDRDTINFLFNAYWVTLEAGYQAGNSAGSASPGTGAIIWSGPVLQVMWNREDVVDFTLTLNCVATIPMLDENFISNPVGRNTNQLQIVSKMITQLGGELNAQISPTAQSRLQSKNYPRGKVLFGQISKYLYQMADDNFLSSWSAGNQVFISDMLAGKPTPDLIYAPPFSAGYAASATAPVSITRSIIGVPRQTPFGTIFRVLLDPRLVVKVPPLIVQLDQAVIQQYKLTFPINFFLPFDQNLTFVAAQIRHRGDTRGNDWETEVTGYTPNYAQILLSGGSLPTAGLANP